MLNKIIAIGGEPASGKTTLMRNLIDNLNFDSMYIHEKFGRLAYLNFITAKVIVFGNYSNPSETFAGTDKLSMAVQPDAVNFLLKANADLPDFDGYTVIFEGDRLFNESFFLSIESLLIPLEIYILSGETAALIERRKIRGSNQSESFLKGRKTKLENIAQNRKIDLIPNNTFEDLQKTAAFFLASLGYKGKYFLTRQTQ